MSAIAIPAQALDQESARLAALREMEENGLPPESELQEIVELAAEICGVPISLLSLVDTDHQRFIASVGIRVRETRRDISFCAHAIQQRELFVVQDTMNDVRFIGNPMVTGDPEIRFYAGIPITAGGDHAVGTLCVIDTVPRTLTRTQERALAVLCNQFKTRLALRVERRALQQALAERDRISDKLHSNERLFQTFMNNGPLLSFMKDEEGRFAFYNSRLAERFRVSQTEWLGKTDFDVFPPEQARDFRKHDLAALESGRLIQEEETTCEDGQCITWRSYKFPCEDEDGRQMLAGFALDVTQELKREAELAAATRELEKVARADSLTGLFTRRIFAEELEPAFDRALQNRQILSLMILDLDNFRQRNARLGTDAGDAVLRQVGAVIKDCLAPGDTGVRYGGAEFAVLMPETAADEARALAERVQARLRELEWGATPVTVSVGIATTQHASRSGRQLFCFADDAMYQAKSAGKNRIVLYRPR